MSTKITFPLSSRRPPVSPAEKSGAPLEVQGGVEDRNGSTDSGEVVAGSPRFPGTSTVLVLGSAPRQKVEPGDHKAEGVSKEIDESSSLVEEAGESEDNATEDATREPVEDAPRIDMKQEHRIGSVRERFVTAAGSFVRFLAVLLCASLIFVAIMCLVVRAVTGEFLAGVVGVSFLFALGLGVPVALLIFVASFVFDRDFVCFAKEDLVDN